MYFFFQILVQIIIIGFRVWAMIEKLQQWYRKNYNIITWLILIALFFSSKYLFYYAYFYLSYNKYFQHYNYLILISKCSFFIASCNLKKCCSILLFGEVVPEIEPELLAAKLIEKILYHNRVIVQNELSLYPFSLLGLCIHYSEHRNMHDKQVAMFMIRCLVACPTRTYVLVVKNEWNWSPWCRHHHANSVGSICMNTNCLTSEFRSTRFQACFLVILHIIYNFIQ